MNRDETVNKKEDIKGFATTIAEALLKDFKDPEDQVEVINYISALVKEHYIRRASTAQEEYEFAAKRSEFVQSKLKFEL